MSPISSSRLAGMDDCEFALYDKTKQNFQSIRPYPYRISDQHGTSDYTTLRIHYEQTTIKIIRAFKVVRQERQAYDDIRT